MKSTFRMPIVIALIQYYQIKTSITRNEDSVILLLQLQLFDSSVVDSYLGKYVFRSFTYSSN